MQECVRSGWGCRSLVQGDPLWMPKVECKVMEPDACCVWQDGQDGQDWMPGLNRHLPGDYPGGYRGLGLRARQLSLSVPCGLHATVGPLWPRVSLFRVDLFGSPYLKCSALAEPGLCLA